MTTEQLKSNLRTLGVKNPEALTFKVKETRRLFIRGLLSRLGDTTTTTGQLRPSLYQKGNNSHPLYNETMAELLERWWAAR